VRRFVSEGLGLYIWSGKVLSEEHCRSAMEEDMSAELLWTVQLRRVRIRA